MTSGQAYARAARPHIILQQALSQMFLENLKEHNTDFVTENQEFQTLAEIFENETVDLENKNIMSKLCITYFRMVTLLKDFIAADHDMKELYDKMDHKECQKFTEVFFKSRRSDNFFLPL